MRAVGTATLIFGSRGRAAMTDLSAAARLGNTLFCASDETAAIEVLHGEGDRFRFAEQVALGDLLALPGGDDAEVDIESLSVDDGWLWLTGSHALTRPDITGDAPRKALRRLAEIRRQPNRFVLARLPLAETRKGRFLPVAEQGGRRAGLVEAGKRSSALIRWVEDDALLAPFTRLPAKENGFDIEGLAVSGDTVWLGLRGPVLRGHAVILQLSVTGAKRGALKAKKLEGGRRLRKHLLDLGGLGVRDLAAAGSDLLILAGPTMMAEGPYRLLRWRKAAATGESAVVDGADLQDLGPVTANGARPEAIAPWDAGRLLVLRDGPAAPGADHKAGAITADLLATR